MNKEEYLNEIDKLNLQKNKYCITDDGAMLLFGLVDEVYNICLKVSSDYFEMNELFKLIKEYELTNHFQVLVSDFNPSDIFMIDGYPVEALERILEQKLNKNDNFDSDKIIKIKKYFKIK